MGTHDESAANRGAAASVFESESWQEAQVASNGAEAENKGDNIDECATKRVPGRIKKPHGFVYFVATDNERFVKIGFTEHLDKGIIYISTPTSHFSWPFARVCAEPLSWVLACS